MSIFVDNLTLRASGMSEKLKVLMTTEGTYPFHHGGVSTWCDVLIKKLKNEIDFIVYSVIMNPFVTQKFSLPEGAELIKVPLWGTEEPFEHLDVPFSKVYAARKRTDDRVIKERFVPLFLELMKEIVHYEKHPEKMGQTLFKLYQYFQEFEYKKSFKSEITWNAYKDFIVEYTTNKENHMQSPGSYSIIHSLGWIYRFMIILNTEIPKVHVAHSSAAAFCGIPCILAKFQYGARYILTEHGVYLREQYLSLSQRGYSSFLNTFLIRMIHSIVNLNYFYADQVSPVCNYNTRWEQRFGVSKEKIETIYNGVDTNFIQSEPVLNSERCPTVVSVARIDPVKDIKSLIQTADIVRKEIPDVKFIVYGSVSVQEYYEECVQLKEELQLGDTFIFAGHTSDVPAAYQSGDVIVLSSISEAFPYSVVEAMMMGKAVVATDVGGIKEAIGNSGIVVPPRNPEQLASGVITLLKNHELRIGIQEEAKERALNFFTIKKFQDLYFKSYIKLAVKVDSTPIQSHKKQQVTTAAEPKQHNILIERGLALLEYGYYNEAIGQLTLALKDWKDLTTAPIILIKIAEAHKALGEFDKSLAALKKVELLIELIDKTKIA